jgi:hypothetical protein
MREQDCTYRNNLRVKARDALRKDNIWVIGAQQSKGDNLKLKVFKV